MTKKILTLVVIFTMLVSCKKSQEAEEFATFAGAGYFEQYQKNGKEMQQYRDNIIKRGDTTSYIELKRIYTYSEHELDFFYYIFIMADVYNYPPAQSDVFNYLRFTTNNNDPKSKLLMEYYLLRAYEAKNESAKFQVEEYFKNKPIPKSKDIGRLLGKCD